ncbi:G2/M phase-specific E3 ubiquitin-protein ligase-like [Oryzias melastigma]|uniref:G2/M phase-specific E3 ubiquitin-protein ligase-like n=1 Tax=Oryzias melastigma TaxID=30732 RepID=UPI00168D7FEF|nr:G2/M phase-specific E3 ubiquitin-protein ligase-like [Oryzias melastigma]
MADDYGGPRREFLRLLMIEITTSLCIFEGQQGNLVFKYNLQSLEQQKYYTAGKLVAWSIIHNGPGPRCLQRELFHMMCGERPDLTHVDVDLLLDPELSANMEKLNSCRRAEALATMKEGIGDWIAACGVPEVLLD